MRFPTLGFRWEWHLRSTPEALWPLVADTNRFNRDAGLPPVAAAGTTGRGHTRRLRYSRFGVGIAWDEEPFEWLRPRRFGVVRRYRSGPMVSMRVLVQLAPLPDGGTRLRYRTWIRPRNLLGLLGAPVVLRVVNRRHFGAVFRRYDAIAARIETAPQQPAEVRLAPGGPSRVKALHDRLLAQSQDPADVDRLIAEVERGDELDLARLRPYALADAWGAPRRRVLELCLRATRAGLLDLQWDVLCPLCRGAKSSEHSLADVPARVHCDSCNIDVTANFDRAVELTFRPNESIRPVMADTFCVGGPQVTPHIVAQQSLAADERRAVAMALEPGRYRMRTLVLSGGRFFVVAPGGAPRLDAVAALEGWPSDEAVLAPMVEVRLLNATEGQQTFICERMAWSDQATTAAEVTGLQIYRDLFSNEVLRHGEQMSVRSLTVLFTDLRDSTRLYQRIGDAPAFGRVLDHFAVLREAIVAEDGALVKTIGDAVMAIFPRPVAALRAILRAQQQVAALTGMNDPLRLKAGLHMGPCIAVTLNERLDYFGSAVNMAARLERFSTGEDAIISDAVRNDPEVSGFLQSEANGLVAEQFEAELKGFDDRRFSLWRVAKRSAGV